MAKPFKPTKAQKDEADRFIDKWQPLLFLHQWHLIRKYSEWADENDADTCASCSADAIYKHATITFYPKFFGEISHTREESVIHELCHCVAEPTKNLMYTCVVKEKHTTWRELKEADERVVQHMTNIIFQLQRKLNG